MPAQVTSSGVAYYREGDTWPALRRCLRDGNGEPIDLTEATVTIRIAHGTYSPYYSPKRSIVQDDPCVVEDQVLFPGFVYWQPNAGDLSPAGDFDFYFTVTYPDGRHQTVAPHVEKKLIIRSKIGTVT